MKYCETCGHYNVCKYKADYVVNCPDYIEPVQHGMWIKTYCCEVEDPVTGNIEKKYKHDCSVCGYHTGYQGSWFNYCPICGAKMGGE